MSETDGSQARPKPVWKKISPETKFYVTPDRKRVFGEQAEELLKRRSDLQYFSDEGVVQVDRQRWAEAQWYERETWMSDQRDAADDRNLEHMRRFGGYEPLEGRPSHRIAEFGCGPFTNIRLILDHVIEPEEITLLDPLVDTYKLHPHCTYKSGQLGGIPVMTVASAIEDFHPNGDFDMVVMVNVLEHCFDIRRVFEVVTDSLRPGGVFVFSDCVFRPHDLPMMVENQYDTGHPIRLSSDYVMEFLNETFRPLMTSMYYGLYGQAHRIDLYFIGEKL